MRRFTSSVTLSLALIALAILSPATGFVNPLSSSLEGKKIFNKTPLQLVDNQSRAKSTKASSVSLAMLNISGGASIVSTLSSSLQSGPFGIPALIAIAATVLTPLTLYRQAYSFTVGYGYSMAAIGSCLLLSFPLSYRSPSFWLTASLIYYGVRLGTFVLFRNISVKSKADKFKEMDKTPKLKRIPFAFNVAIFYSFLASPAMYALRSGIDGGKLVWTGVFIAWTGAILEAVADFHKFIVKRDKDQAVDFAGPTGGLYALTRHPNYLFELVYWLGLYVGGISSFGKNPVAWICSSLGMAGITFIMTNATKKLDKQQEEKYGGQASFDSWKKNVPYPLVPFKK